MALISGCTLGQKKGSYRTDNPRLIFAMDTDEIPMSASASCPWFLPERASQPKVMFSLQTGNALLAHVNTKTVATLHHPFNILFPFLSYVLADSYFKSVSLSAVIGSSNAQITHLSKPRGVSVFWNGINPGLMLALIFLLAPTH